MLVTQAEVIKFTPHNSCGLRDAEEATCGEKEPALIPELKMEWNDNFTSIVDSETNDITFDYAWIEYLRIFKEEENGIQI